MGKTFYGYFLDNMKRLHLPAPESLFGTVTTATTTIGPMVKFIQTYGVRTTVAEMVMTLPGAFAGAGGGVVGFSAAASEAILVVGGLSAAYYVGACIGSLAVATGKLFSGGVSIADSLSAAASHGIETPDWLKDTLTRHPVLLGLTSEGPTGKHPTWIA